MNLRKKTRLWKKGPDCRAFISSSSSDFQGPPCAQRLLMKHQSELVECLLLQTHGAFSMTTHKLPRCLLSCFVRLCKGKAAWCPQRVRQLCCAEHLLFFERTRKPQAGTNDYVHYVEENVELRDQTTSVVMQQAGIRTQQRVHFWEGKPPPGH